MRHEKKTLWSYCRGIWKWNPRGGYIPIRAVPLALWNASNICWNLAHQL